MKRLLILAPFAFPLALAACGGQSPAENKADQLEEAAEQSTPAAANVLENAADAIEEGDVANPDAVAQQALEQAGNVQAPGEATSNAQGNSQ